MITTPSEVGRPLSGAPSNAPVLFRRLFTAAFVLLATGLAHAATTISITAPTVGSVVSVGTGVTFTAVPSTDGGITVAQVQFLVTPSGGSATTIGTVSAAPYSVTWTPSAAGNYTLTAKVIDSVGTAVTSSGIAVTAVTPTTVALTAPTTGSSATVGTGVTLTASATPVGGATISSVSFFANGTQVGAAVTSSPYTTTWTPSAVGTASLTARATDSTGTTVTSSTVSVTVGAAAPTVSISAPALGSVLPLNTATTVTATATAGTGATVAQVQFLQGSTVIGTVTSSPYSISWTPTTAGNYSLTAKVLDTNNVTVTSSAVTVTVATATTVSLTAPANNSAANVGSAVTFSATPSAGTGATISSVSFYVNGVMVGSALTASPYTTTWTPTAAGTYTISARATDSLGNVASSSTNSVIIADASAPTISLSLSPGTAPATTMPSGASRYALATVTPSTGRAIVKVEFFVAGTKVSEKTSAPYVYKYVAPSTTGSYVLLARATDNAGLTSDAQTTLTVTSAVGQAPTALLINPANGSNAIPGTAISLAATAQAVGGTIASVQFYANGDVIGNPITSSPYTGTFTPSTPGTYIIEAIATDNRGNTTVSNAATITAAFTNPTITLTAPTGTVVSPTRATPGTPLTISATAAGGSGATVLLVEFFVGVMSSLVAPSPPSPMAALTLYSGRRPRLNSASLRSRLGSRTLIPSARLPVLRTLM